MALLNAIVETRLKEILENLETINQQDIVEERDLIDGVVSSIKEIIETSGMPLLKIDEVKNPVEEGVSSRYLDLFQRQMIANFTIYEQLIDDIAAKLNVLVAKVGEKLEEKGVMLSVQAQEIQNLREMTLAKLNNISILGEFIVRHETLKDANIFEKNCTITANGSIMLPMAARDELIYDDTVISNLSFRVANPRPAEAKLSHPSNIDGKPNHIAVIPGHFEGKLYGVIERANDIRLGSKITEIFDGKDDTVWECEYVADNPDSGTFTVVVTIRFNKNIWLNRININSENDIEISRFDAANKKIVISDYKNEAAELVYTDNLRLSITQNHYEQLQYNLMAIIRNEYTLHTYNVFETYHKSIREDFERHFPEIRIEPVKEIEQHAGENDEHKVVKKDKYRYAISIADLSLKRVVYERDGRYETDDILVPRNDIYAIELETSAYYPNTDIDWIQYWVSFDSGKNWFRIRSKSESVTNFNNTVKTRVALSSTEEDDANTKIVDIQSNRVRVRIVMQSNDNYITPVVHWYKLRIKMKGEDSG